MTEDSFAEFDPTLKKKKKKKAAPVDILDENVSFKDLTKHKS